MENREVFFYSRVLFWGFGLSLIINITGTGFWIAELLGAAISFLILFFVKRTNNSKILKTISGLVFAFLATAIVANMGGTMYLKETPNIILAFLPLIVGFIIGKSRPEAFKKIVFMLFIYSLFIFVGASTILLSNVNIENVLPFSFRIKDILLGAAVYVLTSVTPVLCLNDFEDKKSLLLNFATSTITVLVMSFLVVTVLGSQEAMLYRYPEFILLKRIKIYEFFSNVENLFVIMIVTDFLSTIAAGVRNMNLKGKVMPYLPLAFLIFVSAMACNHTSFMTFLYKYYSIGLLILLIPTLIPKK